MRRYSAAQLDPVIHGLRPFEPVMVAYIARGGEALGTALAERCGVPVVPLDVAYPLSRLPHPLLSAAIFPFKELLYRLTSPAVRGEAPIPDGARILLVDDSASSGRTLRTALAHLSAVAPRAEVRVVVGRLGKGARPLVDASVSCRRVRGADAPSSALFERLRAR